MAGERARLLSTRESGIFRGIVPRKCKSRIANDVLYSVLVFRVPISRRGTIAMEMAVTPMATTVFSVVTPAEHRLIQREEEYV